MVPHVSAARSRLALDSCNIHPRPSLRILILFPFFLLSAVAAWLARLYFLSPEWKIEMFEVD